MLSFSFFLFFFYPHAGELARYFQQNKEQQRQIEAVEGEVRGGGGGSAEVREKIAWTGKSMQRNGGVREPEWVKKM